MLSYYYEIMQLRSEVIQKVLETKDEHCKAVKISESFIHSSDVRYPFTDNTEDVKLYTPAEIARMAVKQEVNVLDRRGWNPITVQDLLLFDPYASPNLMSELFSTKHSIDEKVRSQILEILKNLFIHGIVHLQNKHFLHHVTATPQLDAIQDVGSEATCKLRQWIPQLVTVVTDSQLQI